DVDRARLDGETEGFVKAHVAEGSDRLVGATIVARHAGEMLPELTVALAQGIGLGKLARVIHTYPTQAEGIRKLGDAYNRTRLTPTVKRLFETWLRWTRWPGRPRALAHRARSARSADPRPPPACPARGGARRRDHRGRRGQRRRHGRDRRAYARRHCASRRAWTRPSDERGGARRAGRHAPVPPRRHRAARWLRGGHRARLGRARRGGGPLRRAPGQPALAVPADREPHEPSLAAQWHLHRRSGAVRPARRLRGDGRLP